MNRLRPQSIDRDNRLPQYPLEVLRVKSGESYFVRILEKVGPTKRIFGLNTHYHQKSHYCIGQGCPAALHSRDTVWKGYLAVEFWVESARHWISACLEVTEALELDLRGRVDRGQVWQLTRVPDARKKRFPVCGLLIEETDGSAFPLAFDFYPVLQWMYHSMEIVLDKQCPLPARPLRSASPGSSPRPEERQPEMSAEQRDANKQKLRELMGRAVPGRNGLAIHTEGTNGEQP